MEVYLSENAFVGLLVSTIEVYQKECFGILLGHSGPERVVVEFAVPYQSAKRKFREVHMDLRRSRRVDEAVETASRWALVGDYHSHPMYGGFRGTTRLSKVDQQVFEEGAIAIVVAINDCQRLQQWGYGRGGVLSGSINGYAIRMAAYYKQEGLIRRAPLLCPYALGFMERKVKP